MIFSPKKKQKKNLIENILSVIFQNIFYLKIYLNNIFYFLKIIFNIINTLK